MSEVFNYTYLSPTLSVVWIRSTNWLKYDDYVIKRKEIIVMKFNKRVMYHVQLEEIMVIWVSITNMVYGSDSQWIENGFQDKMSYFWALTWFRSCLEKDFASFFALGTSSELYWYSLPNPLQAF